MGNEKDKIQLFISIFTVALTENVFDDRSRFSLLQSGKEYLIRHTTCIIITSSVFHIFDKRRAEDISASLRAV